MDVACDEQIGQVWEQPDIEVNVIRQQCREIVIIGGDENAQRP